MEDYLKKMPLLLSLTIGIIMGMFFLYNKKVFSEVFHIILFSSLGIYILGRFLREGLLNIYYDYVEKKNNENMISSKEGNGENKSNKENGSAGGDSKLDLKVEGSNEEFVELARNITKE